MAKDKATPQYLTPGHYTIRATIRQMITVEEGQEITEMEAVDEVILDPGSELVDWEIQ